MSNVGAPVKRASTRAKVPPVQLDGSVPQSRTNCVAARRGGEPFRQAQGPEPAEGQAWSRIPRLRDRNEHMKHINEPRKTTPGSRAPQLWVKAAETESRLTVVGSDSGPAGSACAIPRLREDVIPQLREGDLSWRVNKTQLAAQPLQKGRPIRSWQKSEAFVVAMIPRRVPRSRDSNNPRRNEGTPLVPQK
jgi:hypothetical protein